MRALPGSPYLLAKSLPVILLFGLFAMPAEAYEQPDYEVIAARDGYEVRRYDSYIVAETDVEGGFKDTGSKAFRILAGYIFGDNEASEKMNMTAPVESRASGDSVKMNMTVPVTSLRTEPDADMYTYRFVMESKYTRDTLPVPEDPRVRFRTIEPRTVAVKRYSGLWSESNYQKNEAALLTALEKDGVEVIGEPLLARYDGPLKPWFLRRNEVIVEIDPNIETGQPVDSGS